MLYTNDEVDVLDEQHLHKTLYQNAKTSDRKANLISKYSSEMPSASSLTILLGKVVISDNQSYE